MKNMKLRMILGATVLIAALGLASVASAESSSVETYGGNGGQVAGIASSNTGDPGSTAQASSGSLPFTGMDVSLLIGGGVVLLLAGVGMAKLTARTEPS